MKKLLLTFLFGCLSAGIVMAQGLTLPYYTGFDSPSEQAGWQQYRTGFLSTSDWSIGAPAFSAPNSLNHDYNVGGNSTDTVIDWYVSPPLNFTSQGQVSLKVSTAGFSTPLPDNCEIWFGTNNPNPATGNFVLVANLSYMLPQFQWLDTAVNIAFVSDSGYVAIKYKTIGAAWTTYGIDNINISIVTGIAGNDNDKTQLRIFPNPFHHTATVELNTTLVNASLNIYNVCGQFVKIINSISGNKIKIDRGDLETGIYLIRLVQNNKTIATDKLIFTD